jgi:hypothetical protein
MVKPPSITLTDPSGKARQISPLKVVTVFFNSALAHDKARSNLGYEGGIRSFRETVEQVVDKLGGHILLLRFTLPESELDNSRDIWVSVKRIDKITATDSGGSRLTMHGQKRGSTVTVVESPAAIEAAIL